MFKFLNRLLDTNEREVKKLRLLVGKINRLKRPKAFREKTQEFKDRLQKGETLDNLLPEAYSVVREAAEKTIGLRPFDEQLMAAISFHEGKIAEQKTGEGKTLSAVPALYLNALSEKGCHLVTVNDYLAQRDAGWNGPVFNLLGVSVGVIIHEKAYIFDPKFTNNSGDDPKLKHLKEVSRQEAYRADITYGTNNEFGFDYLRDNMVRQLAEMVQRGHHFAIVDEVDSILIDEARTPLIISAPDTEPTSKYYQFSALVSQLSKDTDYESDEKHKTVNLTDHGIKKIEKKLGVENLYEKDFDTIHHLEQALKAREHFQKDIDYVVKDDEVIIVDEFTGRLMFGRRFSEGLHQAIEAKENVTIKQESKTLATISFQNYFRMYDKLSGMTGTAATEAEEFKKIYNLETVVIPTHKPMIRKDASDMVYKTTRAKYAAIVAEVAERHAQGQPILIGTTSIEKNQIIDEMLKRKKIPHQVLNAKNHLKEASIISKAGEVKAVMVATNMAGRGVDIVLGGDPLAMDKKEWQKQHDKVIKLGGLHVVGVERHESRRIDNQLRGRAGRQGDPGSSRFYVSLEDDIMRIFGGEQIAKLMTTLKMPEDVPLEHPMVSKAIEQAQVKVESFHFDSRKHLVEYDDVMNKQREVIYKRRRQVLEGQVKEKILAILNHEAEASMAKTPEDMIKDLVSIIPFDPDSQKRIQKQLGANPNDLKQIINKTYEQREKQVGQDLMRQVEKLVMLNTIDKLWIDHLDATDDLREGIGLRGYGQRDPLVEYKAEAFNMFERLIHTIDFEVARRIFRVQVSQQAPPPAPLPTRIIPVGKISDFSKAFASAGGRKIANTSEVARSDSSDGGIKRKTKIGRNDPCWCGSGKKWKKCHYPQQAS
ncbi:MAG: Protein translocase subunit SecA [Candidatus Beckwithbacteria bacterium GW2011_GWA2_43_10]|uniref:Protein translocase subunit SecA n=1 Tax=Candidatus Beckwithbacteria bacterium GW2011_GWA2_43_10 TaxID=1618369 RepID=A0A0G1EZE7_9BACT|nr:MAG: Protein translocase subunit SecA [Candidatus Beckwithbacteria bacterium GW2011_GWA2_43_10]